MDCSSSLDIISDLPQSIIECILACLPIRDAVKTSMLSTKWRYKWATLTQLVFVEECGDDCDDRKHVGNNELIIKFVTRVLLLHKGPIHKFHLSNYHLRSCPDIDQWILFLSRNDLKEFILELGEFEWLKIPSCLFSCKKLTRLELFRCDLVPPAYFKGFGCLKSLNLNQVNIKPEAIENLISCCPLLESLALSYFDSFVLNIRAPNLKYLHLEGEFKDICLENTPLLVAISIAMYMTDEIAEYFEQLPNCCNFEKILGFLPRLETLTGHIDFTKFLSIGFNDIGKNAIQYESLRIIELNQVSFEDLKEIQVVLHLIMSSPHLEELGVLCSSHSSTNESDLEFWDSVYPLEFEFEELRTVKVSEVSGAPHELQFVKLLLKHAPALETMRITRSTDFSLNMLTELLMFRRASAKAEIAYVQLC